MPTPTLFNFDVQQEARTIFVERCFNALLNAVWAAWTEADILCKWWAPKPYVCVVTGLDFREGGRWSYYMQGPEGDRHYCFFDYTSVKPKASFSGRDGFCDAQGVVNLEMPRMTWESRFSESDFGTLVRTRIDFNSSEDLEKIIAMGFKEGFTTGLDQLDELLASDNQPTRPAMEKVTYYHGTKADLQPHHLLAPGYNSNYGQRKKANHVYFSATLDAAIWGAELAAGEGRGRIYIVDPTGAFEDDPNLTDKKFPGNPTKSYRTREALRVVGEVAEWTGHAPEQLQAMKDNIQRLKEQGIEAID